MKLTFLGTGSFFAGYDINHTNLLMTTDSGKNLLLDCSSRIPLMLDKLKIDPSVIDAVYVSHMHDDHAGGLEWLAFYSHFVRQFRPELICEKSIMDTIWKLRLRVAAEVLINETATLKTYFCPRVVQKSFVFGGIGCMLAPMIHVEHDTMPVLSFGLMIKSGDRTVYWTSDIGEVEGGCSLPSLLLGNDAMLVTHKRYRNADLIIHDCEVGPYSSRVHTHYDRLKKLPDCFKAKMLLCHYGSRKGLPNAKKDGFIGFAKPGQVVEI